MSVDELGTQAILGSLHKVLLSFDFYNDVRDDRNGGPDPYIEDLKSCGKLCPVPGKFDSSSDYVEAFETLFMIEARSSIDRARTLEMAGPEVVKIVQTDMLGDFVSLKVSLAGGVHGASIKFMTHDLIVLSQGSDPAVPHDVHTLGVVESANPEGILIRIFLDDPSVNNESSAAAASASRLQHNMNRLLKFAHHLNQLDKITWNLSRIMNLSTMQREYLALKSVPNCALVEEILSGQSVAIGVGTLKPKLDGADSFNPPSSTADISHATKLVIPKKLGNILKKNFNFSQVDAVHSSLKIQGITLIQGPPGTGKTSTIMGILSALLAAQVRVVDEAEEEKFIRGISAIKATKNASESHIPDHKNDAGLSTDDEDDDPKNSSKKMKKRKSKNLSDSDSENDAYELKVQARKYQVQSNTCQTAESLAMLLPTGALGSIPSAQNFANHERHYRKAMPWLYDTTYEAWMDVEGLDFKKNEYQANNRLPPPSAPLVLHKEASQTKPRKILICAPSNAAVDELMRRVVAGGCLDGQGSSYSPSLVRIGPNSHPSLQSFSLETIAQKRMKQRALSASLKDEVKAEVLTEARIIAATLSSCGSKDFALLSGDLDTVIVDEASQGIELSTLIALQHGCKRLILVGDPKQLPATVFSKTATDYMFDRSLFQRLETLGKAVTMLSVQYRMHPTLSAYPSKQFYDSQLKDSENINELVPSVAFHALPIFKPLVFFHLETIESNGSTGSISNPDEARFVVQLILVLMKLMPNIDWQSEVGVISPYADQVSLIRSYIKSALKIDPSRQCPIDVNTVDGFQGREKQTIIFSAVRAHPESDSLGFVTDKRRLNVALTRARRNLFIVGHANKLMNNRDWRDLISYSESKKSFLRVSSPQSTFLLRFLNSWLPRFPDAWKPDIVIANEDKLVPLSVIDEIRQLVGEETTAAAAKAAAEKKTLKDDMDIDLDALFELGDLGDESEEDEMEAGTDELLMMVDRGMGDAVYEEQALNADGAKDGEIRQ